MRLENGYSLFESKVARNTDILYGDIERAKNAIAVKYGHKPDDIVILSKRNLGKNKIAFEYVPVFY